MEKQNKIDGKELFSIIFILIAIKSIDMTPLNVFTSGFNASWIFPYIWLVVNGLPFIALLYVLKKYKDKNLNEIIYHLTGKYFGFIINIILVLLLLFAASLNSRSYVDIMNVMVYIRTPIYFTYFAFMLGSFYLAKKGLETIGRVCLIIVPIIIVSMLLLISLVMKDFMYEYLFPIPGPGFKTLAVEGFRYSSLIGEFLIIAVFYPKVIKHRSYKLANIYCFTISCITISFMFLTYTLLFDHYAPQRALHIFSQLTKYTEFGIFITNVDAVFFGLWITAGILRFAIYLYAGGEMLNNTLKLKNYGLDLILPFTALTIILGLIPNNPSVTILLLRDNYLIKNTWIIFITLPFLLWLLCKMKRGCKNEIN